MENMDRFKDFVDASYVLDSVELGVRLEGYKEIPIDVQVINRLILQSKRNSFKDCVIIIFESMFLKKVLKYG